MIARLVCFLRARHAWRAMVGCTVGHYRSSVCFVCARCGTTRHVGEA